jgi:hypothetical protein
VGGELVQLVGLGQPGEDWQETGPRILLIGQEQQPGVVFEGLPPRRPPLGERRGAVV